MARLTMGIIMNGVTGRMGANQHLARSIIAIRGRGGLALDDGDVLWWEPLLVGRHAPSPGGSRGRQPFPEAGSG